MAKRFTIRPMRYFFVFFIFLLISFPLFSQETIWHVEVEGNKIVSEATIFSKIKVRAGQAYNENIINEDIKNLIMTGFFEKIRVDKELIREGYTVKFVVKEKPVLKEVTIEGSYFIRKKKILETIDLKDGAFIDDYKLSEASRKINDLYAKKGFSQAKASYEMEVSKDTNEADVTFIIDEKSVLKVRRVRIEGARAVPPQRILKVMKTRKAWLFNPGIFQEEVLGDDLERIEDFYRLRGYSDIKVDKELDFQKKGLYLTVKIDEGRCYYVGTIEVKGNKEVGSSAINEARILKEAISVFSEQAIYEEASRIKEVYMNYGYVFARVEPVTTFNLRTEKVDVTYKITENEIAYVERIDVTGNARTKDKVIRRELRIYPGNRFDGEKIKKSKERLENLGFFEEIRFATDPGSKPNWVNLGVDVKEAKTGYLSFGGGYSSINEFIGFIEVRQRNFDYKNLSTFTGAGQDLSIQANIGTITDHYQLSFTNPWIFDKPVSFGFDGYKKGHKREEDVGYGYEEDIRGGALRLGREFSDQIKGGFAYRLERMEIRDVSETATSELKDEAGENDLSSGELSLSYDSRDNVFVPSRGIYFFNAFEVTGGFLGGDKDFTKYFCRLSKYFPLVRKSVIELKLRTGFANPFSSTDKVPIYERFFAGGASTIRGYHERKIGPIDDLTEDPLGGEALFVGNIEYTYPLADFLKVATFFDTGNVWKDNSDFLSGGIKSSTGIGLRVKTPIGLVNIDYGWPLNIEPGEEGKEGRFHFNMGREF